MNRKTEKPVVEQVDGEVLVSKANSLGELPETLDANNNDNSQQAQNMLKELKEEVAKKEINGPKGLEPTRYGDWESKGRCYDF